MIGGQPFWRDIDALRVPVAALLEDASGESDGPRFVSAHTAITLASALFNVPRNAILSHRRDPALVRARAMVTWILRTVPVQPMSYPKIGRAMGGRDHTSIMHQHQIAIRLRLEDERFARTCEAICLHFGMSRRLPRGN
jgi:chromosomal replication initiation ATPase DnaA